MKKLIIVRHAKSSWKYSVKDHDRPLKGRGERDAEMISKYTKDMFGSPEFVLSSTANRAKSTASFFIKNWQISDELFRLEPFLYDVSGYDLVKVVKQCDDNINSLMIFGHNFAITDFVNTFGSVYYENVPTCGFVVLEFDTNSWKNIRDGRTIFKVFPKEIRND